MSYCINPKCLKRLNHDDIDNCEVCGTSLLIQGCYRLLKPLRSLERSRYVEVFEIEDIYNNHKVLKILKTSYEELVQLFITEAKVLSWLDHPGIPKVAPEPEGYFKLSFPENIDLYCIVMEKIEGETLSQWLTQDKDCSVDLALKWLKDLTQILEQVHQNNLFHRDIKPSNIIRRPSGQLALIDFGAVKQITEAFYGAEGSSNVLTPGYASPEQLKRQAVPQSDFFALGRTFVHLLTREHPIDLKQIKGRLIWRPYLRGKIPPLLLDLIDDLMHPSANDRPSSTIEIQQRLDRIFHTLLASPNPTKPFSLEPATPKKKWYYPTKIKIAFLFAMVLTIGLISKSQLQNLNPREAVITVGETTLLPGPVPPEKQRGMDAIASGDYTSAIKHLKESIANSQNIDNSETRIFLNNARIGMQKSYTLAVFVPVTCPFNRIKNGKMTSTGSLDSALNILRGVENAQEEINRQGGIHHTLLKVAIACGRDRDDASLSAQEIIKHPEILGVIGTPAREAAQVAERLHCRKIVSLAPNSSSDELKNCDRFVFRMLPSDVTAAKTLSHHMLTVQQKQKAIVFFNAKNLHSRSLQKEFERSLISGGGKVLERFDFSIPKFNAKKVVELALSKKAEVFVLFPDTYILDKALDVINENQRRLPLLAGAHMFDLKTLVKTQQNGLDMVVTASCQDDLKNHPWRYVLAYESIHAFSAALKRTPSRTGIRSALSTPNFHSKGICRPVRFLPSGDRDIKVQLMRVLPGRQSGTGYDFVPLAGLP